MDPSPLLQIEGLCQSFPKAGGGNLQVLDQISLHLNEGEVLGLLGRSGSGKSTLLRAMSGLAPCTAGRVTYRGQPVLGPAPGIAMVFQSFALYPWLTVLGNVQLGLEAQHLPREVIRKRALAAIDLIGLDGFELAFPRELSGGMRQRVGFARALVVNPNILLMDEAFSALDVLTAETLRTDFLDLWSEGQLPIKGVVIVTHNIEEAIQMCDRVLVLSSNPGHIVGEIPVDIPHPRNRQQPAVRALVDRLYSEMMASRVDTATPQRQERFPGIGIGTVLPPIQVNLLSDLMETIAGHKGAAHLPDVSASHRADIDEVLPVVETLQMLRFAELDGGHVKLTDAGGKFVAAEEAEAKRLFGRHVMTYVPLAAHIRRILDERSSHTAPKSRFSDEIEDYMSPAAAEQTLRTVISWGRYADLFDYDDTAALFRRNGAP